MKALSQEAIEATRKQADLDKAENAKKGNFICNRCADTGIIPAPEPYGSIGCEWFCPECKRGSDRRFNILFDIHYPLVTQNALLEKKSHE